VAARAFWNHAPPARAAELPTSRSARRQLWLVKRLGELAKNDHLGAARTANPPSRPSPRTAAICARNCCFSLIRHVCQTEPVLHDSACRTKPDVSRIARWSALRARCMPSLRWSRRREAPSHEPDHVESRNMRRRSVYATGWIIHDRLTQETHYFAALGARDPG